MEEGRQDSVAHRQATSCSSPSPRAAASASEGTAKLSIDFKWADNLQHPGDVMDFYLSGDVAPKGRSYQYVSE